MTHPTEAAQALYALDMLPESESRGLAEHLTRCPACDRLAREYREVQAALLEWREAPERLVADAHGAILQRMRLHRLVNQLSVDGDLRKQAGVDPGGVLAAYGIAPTPALLAAFKELGGDAARFPGELDERLTKWHRLLEMFPGGPPPLGG